MKLILLGNKQQIGEFLPGSLAAAEGFIVADNPVSVQDNEADACIDLLFDRETGRMGELLNLKTNLFIINEVIETLENFPQQFVRFNGWNSFLQRPLVEAAGANDLHSRVEEVFASIGKKTEWVPDIPGLITPRIIASIINEAYFALGESVSSKDDIDKAMKLGTNYPYGPFEWAELIGLKNIADLLEYLSVKEPEYAPAGQLIKSLNN